MDFTLSKLEQTLRSLENLLIDDAADLNERLSMQDPLIRHTPAAFLDACRKNQASFRPFGLHERWGKVNESRVFRLPVAVPDRFAGKTVYLKLITGREGGYTAFNPQFLAYVDGQLRQGLDINHTLLHLYDAASSGQEIEILLHAFAGTEPGLMELRTTLVSIHEDVRQLIHAFRTAWQAMLLLPATSGERTELCEALLKTADALRFHAAPGQAFHDSVQTANLLLDSLVYNRSWSQSPVSVTGIGHTHIDLAWRWTVEQSRQKVQRSFSTAVALMNQYPDYHFFSSQPILYQFIQQDNPDLYARIRQLIRDGRWEAEGGMWLEADCNLPSGESLVRQIYYGKKFLRDEFGIDSQILWLPDSFGYSAVLPQLMKQSGLRYFVTSKLSWNEFNRIPHDIFAWEGLDGSRVLACMITTPDDTGLPNSPDFSTYNATLQPRNVAGVWDRMIDKTVTRQVMMPYGYGDGGGGPTEAMLESARYMKKGLPGLPSLKLGRAADYLRRLEEDAAACRKLPSYRGELYLEFHRGTYTSVAAIKRQNQQAEIRMGMLEMLAAFTRNDQPARRETIWKKILLNQFHDVLPGSAIKSVYDQTDLDYEEIRAESGEMLEAALRTLAGRGAACAPADKVKTLCVVRTAWQAMGQVLLIPGLDGLAVVENGQALPIQHLGDGRAAVAFPSLPAMGWQTFALIDAQAGERSNEHAIEQSETTLENRFFHITIDANGELTAIYDKRARRQVLRAGENGNVLRLYEDRPASCDAWNIDINYVEKEYPLDGTVSVAVTEAGPVCTAVTIRRAFLHSSIIQTVRLFHEYPRIDFETTVDWHESQMLLKAAFPVDVHADEAVCGIQFGSVRRPVHANTPWDEARFESYAHGYVDLSETGYGVSLFTGSKYGVDVMGGNLRLTLLKGPADPWPGADEGRHFFTYSLFPHRGDANEAGVYAISAATSRTAAFILDGVAPDGKMSFASCDCDAISIEAVKPAEDGDGLIVRLCEHANKRCSTNLVLSGLASKVVEAWQCNLLEQNETEVRRSSRGIDLSFRPYEIKTIRIRLQDLSEP